MEDDNLSITVEADDLDLDNESIEDEGRGRIRSEVRVKGRGSTAREMSSTRSEAYDRLGRGDDRMDTSTTFTPAQCVSQLFSGICYCRPDIKLFPFLGI